MTIEDTPKEHHNTACEERTCVVIGAPFADGQELGGVETAPKALRDGGLETVVHRLGWRYEDHGDLPVVMAPESEAKISTPSTQGTGPAVRQSKQFAEGENPYVTNVKHAEVIGQNNGALFDAVYQHAQEGKFVLTIGGDHGLASGSIGAVVKARPNVGVIWVDAHGDCNTPETSPSGNYHGMPMAHLLGWFKQPVKGFEWLEGVQLAETRLAIIALRDLDDAERKMLAASNVAAFTMKDIDRLTMAGVVERALAHVRRGQGCEDGPLHLSLDIDACDPSVAPGTGTKARGGLTYREVHYICETLADTGNLVSMDLVEINPALDPQDEESMHGDDPDISGTTTVRLGIELVASALGKNIM